MKRIIIETTFSYFGGNGTCVDYKAITNNLIEVEEDYESSLKAHEEQMGKVERLIRKEIKSCS